MSSAELQAASWGGGASPSWVENGRPTWISSGICTGSMSTTRRTHLGDLDGAQRRRRTRAATRGGASYRNSLRRAISRDTEEKSERAGYGEFPHPTEKLRGGDVVVERRWNGATAAAASELELAADAS